MRNIKLLLVLIALLLTAPAQAEPGQTGQPGVFDYYLLNLSWEPAFCLSPQHAQSDECRRAGHGFVLHGLWPQFTHGYPEHCSNERARVTQRLDFMPTQKLAQHEWKTHGTCSGLRPDAYFDRMRQAYTAIKIPAQLERPATGFAMAPAQIKQAFVAANPGLRQESIAVSCGNNILTAVAICLGKDDLRPQPCGAVRDCHARVINVAPVR
jgi:ribonuclease T2